MNYIYTFIAALSFLSRIPVSYKLLSKHPEAFEKIPQAFTLVGLFLGFLAGGFALTFHTHLSPLVLATTIITLQIVLTGAFHEDGLADVADSFGRFEKEKKLEIMRDSRLGTFGVLALLLSCLIRFSCIAKLAESEPFHLFFVLIIAGGLSRSAALPLMSLLPYLKNRPGEKGAGAGLQPPTLLRCSAEWIILSIGVALLFEPLLALSLIVMVGLLVYIAGRYFYNSYQGVTGDCLGATTLLTECLVLLIFVLFLSH